MIIGLVFYYTKVGYMYGTRQCLVFSLIQQHKDCLDSNKKKRRGLNWNNHKAM